MTAIGPAEFAINLIRRTITTDRVAAVIARIAGDRIEVGPLRFGPGGAVAATGVGLIGAIQVTSSFAGGAAAGRGSAVGLRGLSGGGPAGGGTSGGGTSGGGQPVAFDASIPGQLTIDLTAGSNGRRHHYEGTVVVPLHIVVLLEAPTRVVLDVAPLRPADVTVRLRTTGVATFILQTLGDANGEVAAQVAAVVNDRVDAVADLRRIDLAPLLDRAWDEELVARLGPAGTAPRNPLVAGARPSP